MEIRIRQVDCVPCVLALVTSLAGCGARSALHDCPDDQPCSPTGVVADAGPDPTDAPEEPEGADSSSLRIGPPIVVLDSVSEGVDLQRFGQLIWLGDKFAVVWCENRDGQIFVVLRFISSAGVVWPDKHVISDPYVDFVASPQSTWLTWTGTELAVFWTIEGGIVMRRVGVDGEILSGQLAVVGGLGAHAYLGGGVPRPGGHALVWIDDRVTTGFYLPYFARITQQGLQLGEQVPLVSGAERIDTLGGFAAQGDEYAMVWNVREAMGIDRVYLSGFDGEGVAAAAPTEIYAAENALLSYEGPSITVGQGRESIAVWDMNRGVVVQRLQNGVASESLIAGDATGAAVIAGLDDGSAGVEYGRGEWETTNPLSTELAFALVGEHGVTAGPSDVNVAPAGQGCLEGYTIASTGDGFGLLWAEGCTAGRAIYFSRVTRTANRKRKRRARATRSRDRSRCEYAGMMRESRAALERALQLKPDYEKAKNALAEHERVAAAVE